MPIIVLLFSAFCFGSDKGIDTRLKSSDWTTYGYNNAETRQSPLTQITAENITKLAPAWVADLTSTSTRAFEATPLVVDGNLYIVTGWSVVISYDAISGKELWRYDPKVPKDYAGKGCCGPVSRGVAYAGGHIFLATFDGRLVALNAQTGTPIWTTLTVDQSQDYTITGAPRVVGDNVIIGNGGAEYGVRGYVSAYSIKTGELAWRFYTVPPKPGFKDNVASDDILEKAVKTWSGKWWELGGGGTVWDSMAYDPELDLLYVGVGNGGPWNRQMRSDGEGDNLFVSSILALRPKTGEYVWHFQTTPGDEWDYTATQSIILADLSIGGVHRKVLMQAPKNGYFYVLDRTTGKFISGEPYVDVTWATGLDQVTGRPIESSTVRYSESGNPSVQRPGPSGAHNWQPMSFSSKTGYAYIPARRDGFKFVAANESYKYYAGSPNNGIDPVATALPDDPALQAQIKASLSGELIAWDPIKQKVVWSISQPVSWNGGTLVTDSNLVFQGDALGDLVAYDASNGNRIWSINLGAGIIAPPITYQLDGEQYIAVAVGWGGGVSQVVGAMTDQAKNTSINHLVVLKLGGKAVLPSVPVLATPNIYPIKSTFSSKTIEAGRAIYERRCFICHGSAAISGGEVPDLRRSPFIVSADSFNAVVQKGALAPKGMPSFGRDLNDDAVEELRAYLIYRANFTIKSQQNINIEPLRR
jgi:PQQ-dependent dehydrogenase (methanol/ethanol family)